MVGMRDYNSAVTGVLDFEAFFNWGGKIPLPARELISPVWTGYLSS